MGMRSRAPPVADAARRSIRSGRKNRASEQREDFFGHRKAARAADWPRSAPQEVTLPRPKFEQAVICPDGPSPATGEGDGEGADAPAATLGAYLCAVRTMLQHRSYPALQATERGSSRGKLSPLTVFWFLLYAQKERLRGERCLLCLCKRLRDADRREEIWYKGGRGARVRDYIFPRGNPAGRRKKLAPQGFDNLRNVH